MFLNCLHLSTDGECAEYCSFSKFLWHPLQNGTHRKWFGRTEYVRSSESWRTQEEISVGPTEILIELRTQISCSVWPKGGARDQSTQDEEGDAVELSKLTCYKKEILRKIVCLREEPGTKFRVLETTAG